MGSLFRGNDQIGGYEPWAFSLLVNGLQSYCDEVVPL